MEATLFFEDNERMLQRYITTAGSGDADSVLVESPARPVTHDPRLGGLASLFNMSGSVAFPVEDQTLTVAWWVHRGATKITLAAMPAAAGASATVSHPPALLTIPVEDQLLTCGITTSVLGQPGFVLVWVTVPSATELRVSWLPCALRRDTASAGWSLAPDVTAMCSEILPVSVSVTSAAVIAVSRDPESFASTVFVTDGYDIFAHDLRRKRPGAAVAGDDGPVADADEPLVSAAMPFAPAELAPYEGGTKSGLASFLPWGRPTRAQKWIAMAPIQGAPYGLVLAHVSGKMIALYSTPSVSTANAANAPFFSVAEVLLPQGCFSHQMCIAVSGSVQTGITILTDAALPGEHVITVIANATTPDGQPDLSKLEVTGVLDSPTPGSVPFGHAVLATPAAASSSSSVAVVYLAEDVDSRPASILSSLHANRHSKAAALLQISSTGQGGAADLFLSTSARLDCVIAAGGAAFVLVESTHGNCKMHYAQRHQTGDSDDDNAAISSWELIPSPALAAASQLLSSGVSLAGDAATATTPAEALFAAAALTPFAASPSTVWMAQATPGLQPFRVGAGLIAAIPDGPAVLCQLVADTVKASGDAVNHHAFLELTSTARSCGFTSGGGVADAHVLAAIALALQPLPSSSSSSSRHAVPAMCLSRRYVFERVQREVVSRIVLLVVTQLALVASDPAAAAMRPACFRRLRAAIDLLCAALLAIHAVRDQLLTLAASDEGGGASFLLHEAVARCFHVFVHPDALDDLSAHVVCVSKQLERLPMGAQLPAVRVWAEGLRVRCPLACHMLAVATLASGRTNRSAQVESLVAQVALYASQCPSPLLFDVFNATSIGLNNSTREELLELMGEQPDMAPRLYRSLMLRHLVAPNTAWHPSASKTVSRSVLVSSHTIEQCFLPDLLLVLEQLAPRQDAAAMAVAYFTELLGDVHLVLSRTAAESRQYAVSCRHAIAAHQHLSACRSRTLETGDLPSSGMQPEAAALVRFHVADAAVTAGHTQCLIDLPIQNASVNRIVEGQMIHAIVRDFRGARSSSSSSSGGTAPAAVCRAVEVTQQLLQFLSRRRAYGKAARVAYEVARWLRDAGGIAWETPFAPVERLLGQASQFLRSIPDVPPADEDNSDSLLTDDFSAESFGSRSSMLSREGSTSMRLSTEGSSMSLASVQSRMAPMSRASIALVDLRMLQSQGERAVAALQARLDDAAVNPKTYRWMETALPGDASPVKEPCQVRFADGQLDSRGEPLDIRSELLQKLIRHEQWALAEAWALATGQDVSQAFAAEATLLLWRQHSAASSGAASSSTARPGEQDDSLYDASLPVWHALVHRLQQHASPANNFGPLNHVVRAALHVTKTRLVPMVLKDALFACDPAGLIDALLCKWDAPASTPKARPQKAAFEAALLKPHDSAGSIGGEGESITKGDAEALWRAFEYLRARRGRTQQQQRQAQLAVIPFSVLDRVAALAKTVLQTPAAERKPIHDLAENYLRLVAS